jgi:hypothetical protein
VWPPLRPHRPLSPGLCGTPDRSDRARAGCPRCQHLPHSNLSGVTPRRALVAARPRELPPRPGTDGPRSLSRRPQHRDDIGKEWPSAALIHPRREKLWRRCKSGQIAARRITDGARSSCQHTDPSLG